MDELKQLDDIKTLLGEGPIWVNNHLYWVDIIGKNIQRLTSDGQRNLILLNKKVGCIAPSEGGQFIIAQEDGFYFLEWETEKLTFICDPESKLPGNRFNDGKIDPKGRFWAGTMDHQEEKTTGSLYMLDGVGIAHKKLRDVQVSNGICWSLDHSTMYFSDSPTQKIDAFDFEISTGNLSNRRTIIQFKNEGYPDGMTIDEKGNLWIALWNGYAVVCYNPDTGERLRKIEIPVRKVSSCTFGGKDLKTLFITTAQVRETEEHLQAYPQSGGIFSMKVDVPGIPCLKYRPEMN